MWGGKVALCKSGFIRLGYRDQICQLYGESSFSCFFFCGYCSTPCWMSVELQTCTALPARGKNTKGSQEHFLKEQMWLSRYLWALCGGNRVCGAFIFMCWFSRTCLGGRGGAGEVKSGWNKETGCSSEVEQWRKGNLDSVRRYSKQIKLTLEREWISVRLSAAFEHWRRGWGWRATQRWAALCWTGRCQTPPASMLAC